MSLVVTGSLAYDHIMVFKDAFKNHILPDKVHMINVAFNIETFTKDYGGTAGNIAYSLALLGLKPHIVATVGRDFEPYFERIAAWGLNRSDIKVLNDSYTAQAFITTDIEDNQITAFHGGAMFRAHEQPLSVVKRKPRYVIISPNDPRAMEEHAAHCREKSLSFWFDPGQAMNALTTEQLVGCFRGAEGLIVNDYEWEMFQRKSGLNLGMILEEVPAVLVTKGSHGVELLTREGMAHVPAVPDVDVVDPTGAGDAFRAGLLYGLRHDVGLLEACRYASAVASFAVEAQGTQNHQFSLQGVNQRVKTLSS